MLRSLLARASASNQATTRPPDAEALERRQNAEKLQVWAAQPSVTHAGRACECAAGTNGIARCAGFDLCRDSLQARWRKTDTAPTDRCAANASPKHARTVRPSSAQGRFRVGRRGALQRDHIKTASERRLRCRGGLRSWQRVPGVCRRRCCPSPTADSSVGTSDPPVARLGFAARKKVIAVGVAGARVVAAVCDHRFAARQQLRHRDERIAHRFELRHDQWQRGGRIPSAAIAVRDDNRCRA